MKRIRVTRAVDLPDDLAVSRCRRVPELGPRILFFTGGTAMRGLSRAIKKYTHNTIHLVTPFDSGGSSAKLRAAFDMPSVGDLRNRLIALADESVRGNPEIYRFFSYRFEREADDARLRRRVNRMVDGSHPLVAAIPEPLRHIVRTHLECFADNAPADFDLGGASVGNLVLVGGYLNNGRDIDAVVFLFSKLVAVLGIVRPITDASLHLAARLVDGTRVLGQHHITGKEAAPIASPIECLELVADLDSGEPATVSISEKMARYIERADLICYPVGSLWTSVLANLLPAGVGSAIRRADGPKVYVPNAGTDHEQLGMKVSDCVEQIVRHVRADAGDTTPIEEIVNFVLVDTESADYGDRLDPARLTDMGVQVIDVPLVSERSQRLLAPEPLAEILLSLC